MSSGSRRLAVITALAAIPSAAFAHTGAGDTTGFVQGLIHPIGGVDHVLVMVAIGVLATILGGRALWLVPGTFMLMMALGGAYGMSGGTLLLTEPMIALSVIALGFAIMTRTLFPMFSAVLLAGGFAIFHGHAHGVEMLGSSGAAYAAGFLLATALLLATGIAIGLALNRLSEPVLRGVLAASGGAMVLAGFIIMLWSPG